MSTGPLLETISRQFPVAVLPDAESLTLAAATVIVAEARRSVRESGRFTIALSGGATPKPVYEALAGPPFGQLVPWEATHVFWGDERCVDPTDERSNQRMARRALLDRVPIPNGQIHPMRCHRPGKAAPSGAAAPAGHRAGAPATPPDGNEEAMARRSAADYEGLLRDFFGHSQGMDLILLGLGDDGHTASLFPGSEVLTEQKSWVAAAYEDATTAAATSHTGERLWRVTLTAPFINRSRVTVFVVAGASKASAVRGTLRGDANPQVLPARLIRPLDGRVLWLLDEGAASELEQVPVSDLAGAARAVGLPDDEPTAAAPEHRIEPESFDDLEGCELGPSR